MIQDWPRIKLGYLIQEAGGSTPSKANPEFWDGDIPWVSPKDMKVELISDSIDHVSSSALAASSLRTIPTGAILMVVRGMILAHTVPIAETTGPVTLNQDMKALLPTPRVWPRFLRYAMKAAQRDLLSLVEVAGHGTCCLRSERWRKHEILVPPIGEQRAIADFLDRKTAAIDDLIAKKERLLALLAEKRAALIHRAVTKGLDPSVPMKDSGVPWIGNIPEHWHVRRMRYLCRITTGGRDTQDARKDGQYPFFVRSDNVERIDTYSFDGEAVLTSGDGAGVGKIFHHYVGKLEFHQRVYLFYSFRDVLGRYLYFFIKQHLATVVLEGTAKSTVDSIRRHMLTNFPIAFGSEREQKEIIDFLDGTLAKMQAGVQKVEQQVERLHEYRQALITAAVTGQLDVTASYAPNPPDDHEQLALFQAAP